MINCAKDVLYIVYMRGYYNTYLGLRMLFFMLIKHYIQT